MPAIRSICLPYKGRFLELIPPCHMGHPGHQHSRVHPPDRFSLRNTAREGQIIYNTLEYITESPIPMTDLYSTTGVFTNMWGQFYLMTTRLTRLLKNCFFNKKYKQYIPFKFWHQIAGLPSFMKSAIRIVLKAHACRPHALLAIGV